MNKQRTFQAIARLSLAGLILFTQARIAHGQYTGNKPDVVRPDLSKAAPDIRAQYPLLKSKCGECHDLEKSLKANMSSAQWSPVVKQMQAMPSAHISDRDAQKITSFLTVVAGERPKGPGAAAAPAQASDAAGAGKQF